MANREEYLKKMELKNKAKLEAGLVSERFPNVTGIKIKMTYYHNSENPVLMERTINVFPSSYAYFNMDCMIRGCSGGGFDLNSIVAKQIKKKEKTSKGKMPCKGKIADLSSDHAHISYDISVQYNKRTKKS